MISKEQLIAWYENLNPETLNDIHQFYADDTYFRDPFHELFELDPLIKVYEDMFAKIKDPKFVITKDFFNEKTDELVLFWDFKFTMLKKEMVIKGNTLFKFNAEGKINYHVDFWDSVNELWMKVPVIGFGLKLFYKILF